MIKLFEDSSSAPIIKPVLYAINNSVIGFKSYHCTNTDGLYQWRRINIFRGR